MISNLLDTHALIWFLDGDDSLSKTARKAIENNRSVNFVSIASLWEIAIKVSLKKLEINASLADVFSLVLRNGFVILPILPEEILVLAGLPFHHRDPFDRLIIAQALYNDLAVITKDDNFKAYEVNCIW